MDLWLSPGRLEWGPVELLAKVIVWDDRATAHGFRPGTGSVIRAGLTDAGNAQPVPGTRLLALSSEAGAPVAEGERSGGGSGGQSPTSRSEGRELPDRGKCNGLCSRVLENVRFGTNDYREYAVALARPATLTGLFAMKRGRPLVLR